MKSGAPAFGVPEHLKAGFGAGQQARRPGLRWRRAARSAANMNDARAARETEIAQDAPPAQDPGRVTALDAFTARRSAAGGAAPGS